MAKYITDKQTQ